MLNWIEGWPLDFWYGSYSLYGNFRKNGWDPKQGTSDTLEALDSLNPDISLYNTLSMPWVDPRPVVAVEEEHDRTPTESPLSIVVTITG